MIHGSGVDSAMLLAITARLPTTVGRTSSAPPSISPSASGGMSRSYHHVSLFFGNLFFGNLLFGNLCSVCPKGNFAVVL